MREAPLTVPSLTLLPPPSLLPPRLRCFRIEEEEEAGEAAKKEDPVMEEKEEEEEEEWVDLRCSAACCSSVLYCAW